MFMPKMCEYFKSWCKLPPSSKRGFQAGPHSDPVRDVTSEDDDTLTEIESESTIFKEWKLISIKTHKETQAVDPSSWYRRLQTDFQHEVAFIRKHQRRVFKQIRAIDNQKRNLNATSVVVKMDYSGNYRCHFKDEPSALYYDACQISIYPMVAYRCDGPDDADLAHQGFVEVSSVTQHSAPTTLAFLKLLIPHL